MVKWKEKILICFLIVTPFTVILCVAKCLHVLHGLMWLKQKEFIVVPHLGDHCADHFPASSCLFTTPLLHIILWDVQNRQNWNSMFVWHLFQIYISKNPSKTICIFSCMHAGFFFYLLTKFLFTYTLCVFLS